MEVLSQHFSFLYDFIEHWRFSMNRTILLTANWWNGGNFRSCCWNKPFEFIFRRRKLYIGNQILFRIIQQIYHWNRHFVHYLDSSPRAHQSKERFQSPSEIANNLDSIFQKKLNKFWKTKKLTNFRRQKKINNEHSTDRMNTNGISFKCQYLFSTKLTFIASFITITIPS